MSVYRLHLLDYSRRRNEIKEIEEKINKKTGKQILSEHFICKKDGKEITRNLKFAEIITSLKDCIDATGENNPILHTTFDTIMDVKERFYDLYRGVGGWEKDKKCNYKGKPKNPISKLVHCRYPSITDTRYPETYDNGHNRYPVGDYRADHSDMSSTDDVYQRNAIDHDRRVAIPRINFWEKSKLMKLRMAYEAKSRLGKDLKYIYACDAEDRAKLDKRWRTGTRSTYRELATIVYRCSHGDFEELYEKRFINGVTKISKKTGKSYLVKDNCPTEKEDLGGLNKDEYRHAWCMSNGQDWENLLKAHQIKL